MKGVLLVNLGSPDSTAVKDVRKYLDEFLMDKRVIDIPYWKRWLLIKGIILRFRPKKSAEAYKKIWWPEGSPLVVISERFAEKVNKSSELPVELGMRYGSMSIEKGIQKLHDKGVTEFLLVPLYPHYAMSSYETVVVKAEDILRERYHQMKMEVLPAFYDHPDYIKVMAANIKKQLIGFEHDHILFSYHGIPERHIRKSDTTNGHCQLDGQCCEKSSEAHKTCYRHQCFETTKGIVKELNLEPNSYSNSFQSRLLKDPWLKPYTDFEFDRLPKEENKKHLAVVTPAFVSDCLETLEEIAMEGEEQFHAGGGETYKHIPCMNDNDDWVAVMNNWIKDWAIIRIVNFLYLKSLHIIFVVTWFAGLFYIVRLFIYHTETKGLPEESRNILQNQYKLMSKRLWTIICWPSAIITLILAILLIYSNPSYLKMPWMHIKLGFVLLLYVYHFASHRIYKQLQNDVISYTSNKLRIWNEIATILLFAIVFLVVLKSTTGWIWGVLGLVGLSIGLMLAIKAYRKIRKI